MSRNELWQARLPNDMHEALTDYIEDKDISKSEALRRGVLCLLVTEEYMEPPDARKPVATAGQNPIPFTRYAKKVIKWLR